MAMVGRVWADSVAAPVMMTLVLGGCLIGTALIDPMRPPGVLPIIQLFLVTLPIGAIFFGAWAFLRYRLRSRRAKVAEAIRTVFASERVTDSEWRQAVGRIRAADAEILRYGMEGEFRRLCVVG